MPSVYCNFCGLEYANRRNLNRHINVRHRENVICKPCPVAGCIKIYVRSDLLTTHLRVGHGLSRRESADTCRRTQRIVLCQEEFNRRWAIGRAPSSTASSDTRTRDVENMEDEVPICILPFDAPETITVRDMTPEVQNVDAIYEEERPGPSGENQPEPGSSDHEDEESQDIIFLSDSEEENPEPSGDGDHEYPEEHPGSVRYRRDAITISLITTTLTRADGSEEIRRQQIFTSTNQEAPHDIDWISFLHDIREEIRSHNLDLNSRRAEAEDLS